MKPVFIRVERDSSIPVSRQIADQIRAQCLSGALAAGARIPSVRQLARDLAVNQNTVLRVYERLTAESLLEMSSEGGAEPRGDLMTRARGDVADGLQSRATQAVDDCFVGAERGHRQRAYSLRLLAVGNDAAMDMPRHGACAEDRGWHERSLRLSH